VVGCSSAVVLLKDVISDVNLVLLVCSSQQDTTTTVDTRAVFVSNGGNKKSRVERESIIINVRPTFSPNILRGQTLSRERESKHDSSGSSDHRRAKQ
jgi:hypothetical protein